MGVYVPFFPQSGFGFSYPAVPHLGFLGFFGLFPTASITVKCIPMAVFAINRFEVLADLQAPVSTLLYVCFPGECRQN